MNINDLRACCQAVVNGEPDAEVRLCECVLQLSWDEYPLNAVVLIQSGNLRYPTAAELVTQVDCGPEGWREFIEPLHER